MIIRKLCATIKFASAGTLLLLANVATPALSQDSEASTTQDSASAESANNQIEAVEVQVPSPVESSSAKVTYPRAVALLDGKLLVVDLDLPGIWVQQEDSFSVYTPGTKLLRKPMNRPWCVTPHPAGGILIGDSATREIYHAKSSGTDLIALNGGFLGIPMALAVDQKGEFVFVGDAERRAVFRFPIAGGQPELIARVNARALSFDSQGNLWAVTPDAEAIQKIDVAKKTAETVVGGRPYQFPNGLVWAGEEGFVTDGYGRAIWRFTADGKTEKWHEGEPLSGPVGITADEKYLYVADPRKKQVFRFDRQTKAVEPVLKNAD